MRSYNQSCGLAKALDLVGDRWTLLIVRELLIRGAARYTDLRNGLPGIATNLLAERLKELEASGLVAHEDAPPPIATTLFSLTPRGAALEPILLQLGAWGAPDLASSAPSEAFQDHWIVLPLKLYLQAREARLSDAIFELRAGAQSITVEAVDGKIEVRLGRPARGSVGILSGPPRTLLNLVAGRSDLRGAEQQGLRYEGDLQALQRFLPAA